MNPILLQMASRAPSALRHAAFAVFALFASAALLEQWWRDPDILHLANWLPGVLAGVAIFVLLASIYTVAPAVSHYLLIGASALYWTWLLLGHGLPSDPRSGLAVLVRFVPWTVLAWPVFGLAVSHAWRPASSAQRLVLVIAGVIWTTALVISWPFGNFALDVGLPPGDYFGARLGWIAWMLVAPAPLVVAGLVLGVLATVRHMKHPSAA